MVDVQPYLDTQCSVSLLDYGIHRNEAHPNALNICLPSNGRPQPAQERRSVAAAIAEAEYGVKASTRYTCIDC